MYKELEPAILPISVFEISDYIGGMYNKARARVRLPPRPNDRISSNDEQ